MKYFEICANRTLGHMPQLLNRYNDYNRQEDKNIMLFNIKDDSELENPGVMVDPFFMVEESIKNILEKYEPNISFKTIILIGPKDEQILTYYMPILTTYESVDIGKETDKVIYLVKDVFENHVIVRMDFTESILKRETAGFLLKEV